MSGGPDSMSMLLLAHQALAGEIEVAAVDHGLRPEAADECALVQAQCELLAVRCEILRVDVAEGNVQDQARDARYAALMDWAKRRQLGAVATAHHADDQAETVLMRLNRGAGLQGLGGIRGTMWFGDSRIPVIRPLLGFRRAELRQIVEDCGIGYASDPSNEDPRFDRVRIRRALAQSDWLDPQAIARSALHLAEAEAALDAIATLAWDEGARVATDEVSVPCTPVADTQARLLVRAAKALGLRLVMGEVIALVRDRLGTTGSKVNLGGALIERLDDGYRVTREPPRRPA
ncbi:tRNA lysidine(34) synthetase TilS [Parerythrobacter aurantius]|uniref:tRNA lysidine(34) synthetase TilS n=1 Tax=Parerythrobacter aurantius TaxID=3127706 RepID=UPI00324CBB2D